MMHSKSILLILTLIMLVGCSDDSTKSALNTGAGDAISDVAADRTDTVDTAPDTENTDTEDTDTEDTDTEDTDTEDTDTEPISATGLPVQGQPTDDQKLPLPDPPLETWVPGDFTGIEYLRLQPANQHQYSKRQAFDFDERWVSFGQTVIDLENGYAEKPSRLSREHAWSHTTGGVLYGLRNASGGGRTQLSRYDVNTEVRTDIENFARYRSVSLGNHEGSISNDDKYIVFLGTLPDDSKEIFSYDLQTQSVVATMSAGPNLDWAGVSQRGQYVLVSYSPDNPSKLLRYNMDLTDETLLTNDIQHGDFCIDAAGDEVYAMVGVKLRWVRLRDGESFTHNLGPGRNWGHVSCRNYRRPGWAYVTVVLDGQFMAAVNLVPDADQCEAWAFPRHTDGPTPRGTVSPSGRMILFSSDWAGGSEFIARTTL